ncbi:MAG: 16S rRNA (guanine(527)-N(7))-methyltransferase RsmG [Firmicutes bacterium]|nr:16S rRNA (guanine(527)-N(7))-methyltransferase RsmG [Bacillota bacterium]
MELGRDLGLSPQEAGLLQRHWQAVQEAGSRFNLTAVADAEAGDKHYRDCLAAREPVAALPSGSRVLDLGSGAGFPGLVLAAVCPEQRFILVDATAKKCDFLRQTAGALALTNVEVVCGRAEELGRGELRESCALVTARAVAALRELVELALPLLQHGGRLLALKGGAYGQEIDEASHALSELGGRVSDARTYTLPGGEQRALVLVEKLAPTPAKYPRRTGLPHKRPL